VKSYDYAAVSSTSIVDSEYLMGSDRFIVFISLSGSTRLESILSEIESMVKDQNWILEDVMLILSEKRELMHESCGP